MSKDFEAAWQRYFPLVREKCRRVLRDGDEADDVAQEVLIRYWQYRAHADVRVATAWLYRAATNLCIDRLRVRGPKLEEGSAEERAPDLEAATASRQLLGRLLQEVDDEALQVAVLTRVDGLTQPETAEVLGISERTVRRVLTRLDVHLQRRSP